MKIYKSRDVKTPERGTSLSAGLDFFTPNDFPSTMVMPGRSVLIESGIYVSIPKDTALVAMNKSSIASQGLILGACVVDADYQGEVKINLINTSDTPIYIHPGKKITQFLLIGVEYPAPKELDSLDNLYNNEITERGAGGFGSTNK